MTEFLQPHSLELVVEWRETEETPDVDFTMPVVIRVIVSVEVKPGSKSILMKNAGQLENIQSWYGWAMLMRGEGMDTNVKDMGDEHIPTSGLEAEGVDRRVRFAESQDSEVQNVHSPRSSVTPRPSAMKKQSSKIPVRKFGLDGSLDDQGDQLMSDVTYDSLFDDIDNVDMLPSPTPSSQNDLPWTSTDEIMKQMDANGNEGEAGGDVEDMLSTLLPLSDPLLRLVDGDLRLDATEKVETGIYKAEIVFWQFFTATEDGWYVVDLSDIISTCPQIPGDIVFDVRRDAEIEGQIVGLEAHEVDDRLVSRFDPRDRPFVSLRIRKFNDELESSVENHDTYANMSASNEMQCDEEVPNDLLQNIEEDYANMNAGETFQMSQELLDEYLQTMGHDSNDPVDQTDYTPPPQTGPIVPLFQRHYMLPPGGGDDDENKIGVEEFPMDQELLDEILQEMGNDSNDLVEQTDNTQLPQIAQHVTAPQSHQHYVTFIPAHSYQHQHYMSFLPEDDDENKIGPEEFQMDQELFDEILQEMGNDSNDVVEQMDDTPPPQIAHVTPQWQMHYMSPIPEEEELPEEQDDKIESGGLPALKSDDVISESEERLMTPSIEEEEVNSDNVISESEERLMTPSIEEEEVNSDNVMSESEERLMTPIIEEEVVADGQVDDTIPESEVPESEERLMTPIIEEEAVEDDIKFGYSPCEIGPDYNQSLKFAEEYLAMFASHSAFRHKVINSLRLFLPALFIFILTICACFNGPPDAISTTANTLRTVKYYATHMGGLGYTALKNVNVPLNEFRNGQREWFERETSVAISDHVFTTTTMSSSSMPTETMDFSKLENVPLQEAADEVVDETLAKSDVSHDSVVVESPESTALLDTEPTSTPEPIADDDTLAVNAQITSTPDLHHPLSAPTASPEKTTSILSFAIKEGKTPRTYHPRYDRRPRPSLPGALSSLAKNVLRHVACSTSPACVVARVSDKYDPPWQIFSRFDCDGKGGWKASTARDGFDRALGWTPAECLVD